MALPRSPGLKTEVSIAMLVPKIIALDNPWNIRKTIRERMLWENSIRNVEIVNSKIPSEKIFFLPKMSPSLPNGIRKMAEDKRKLLITQPRLIAFAWRSLPIAGRARLTAELRKGTRNAAKVETRSTDFLNVLSSVRSSVIIIDLKINISTFQHSIIPLFQIIPFP
jgi:hypothetical protein